MGKKVLDPAQRRSHANLLVVPQTQFDAIIVPSARPAPALSHAIKLAARHGCPLLVLCSRESRAKNVVEFAARSGATVVAVDVTGRERLQPDAGFASTRWITDTRFAPKSDVAFKRNAGLALARMAGWQRVLFLDDDVEVVGKATLKEAAALLNSFDIVGLRNAGFPDNSVVCHAIRTADESQGTFVGGGAIGVAVDRVRDFFPHVFNEDWLFFANSLTRRRVALAGTMLQARYNPFASSERAKREEFGDVLAEGLYAVLGQDATDRDADEAFWTRFVKARAELIEATIADKRADGDPARALRAARQATSWVRPADIVTYLDHWRQDTETWRAWYEDLPVVGDLREALKKIDVKCQVETGGLKAVTPGDLAAGALSVYLRLLRSPRRLLVAAAQVARPPR